MAKSGWKGSGMKLRPALYALSLLGVGFALAQETTFRVDVKLVRILATVKDSAGRLVGSLEQ